MKNHNLMLKDYIDCVEYVWKHGEWDSKYGECYIPGLRLFSGYVVHLGYVDTMRLRHPDKQYDKNIIKEMLIARFRAKKMCGNKWTWKGIEGHANMCWFKPNVTRLILMWVKEWIERKLDARL